MLTMNILILEPRISSNIKKLDQLKNIIFNQKISPNCQVET